VMKKGMPMTIYEAVKNTISVPDAAAQYGWVVYTLPGVRQTRMRAGMNR